MAPTKAPSSNPPCNDSKKRKCRPSADQEPHLASNLIAQERRQTWGPDLEKSTGNEDVSKIDQNPEAGANKNERLDAYAESLRQLVLSFTGYKWSCDAR
ncbi:uncharacterized protein FFB20_04687 [Fusarium fujikuroi]|nr:uncharacterized protein FFB20_04687 [Fusarium fujikuroi]SCN89708.1 uncharacterized protein FFC1_05824 [Fusarium fujikuroi]SCN93943.1 uncharacterized protein FFE2_07916 [Fusarium fujikuroi]SCO21581.1 uncharacterized protein FFM5_12685 [Fusarium fujikuroi]SCO41597.1 uncharacterized protein FFNC_08030 [Fusarium fujikuroi]